MNILELVFSYRIINITIFGNLLMNFNYLEKYYSEPRDNEESSIWIL